MRNFHVILKDGTERNIRADAIDLSAHGMLSFLRNNQDEDVPDRVLVYNAPDWLMVEVESQDDRGE